ncbi:hypothetical protein [Demequina aurantiaca]|uniref:hypothetical protein n=1 Tax=Demequina aurantiaca TaxID=676200 RepID=UPI003D34A575
MSAVPVDGSPSSARFQSQWRYFPFVQAGAAAVLIFLNVTSEFDQAGTVTLLVWAVLQVIAYHQWPDHPFRYRVFSALAGLIVFSACFLPAFFLAEPVGAVAALALAAIGSAPTWALAIWVLRRRAQEPVPAAVST